MALLLNILNPTSSPLLHYFSQMHHSKVIRNCQGFLECAIIKQICGAQVLQNEGLAFSLKLKSVMSLLQWDHHSQVPQLTFFGGSKWVGELGLGQLCNLKGAKSLIIHAITLHHCCAVLL